MPSLISIAVSQTSGGGSGSMKASEFVKNLKELVVTGGWGHRLLSALIQAVTDEHPEAAEEFVTAPTLPYLTVINLMMIYHVGWS